HLHNRGHTLLHRPGVYIDYMRDMALILKSEIDGKGTPPIVHSHDGHNNTFVCADYTCVTFGTKPGQYPAHGGRRNIGRLLLNKSNVHAHSILSPILSLLNNGTDRPECCRRHLIRAIRP